MTITILPDPPSRGEPSTFSAKTDLFLAALPGFVTEANAVGVAADADAAAALVSEGNAAASEFAAAGSAAAAVTYSGAAAYIPTDHSYDYPDAVIGSDGNTYICLGSDVSGDDPVGSVSGDWKPVTTDLILPEVKTSAFTAVRNVLYMVNTTSAAITVTLPYPAAVGDSVYIADYAGTFNINNCTVGRNGNNLMGLAEDMTVTTPNVSLKLMYIDSTQGWRLI